MAKGSNNGKQKKSHVYKPYDSSNSFVNRFTTRVSEILPQSSSWISRWLNPTDPQLSRQTGSEDEDDDEEVEHQAPAPKRQRLSPNQYNDLRQNHAKLMGALGKDSGEISPILSNRISLEEKAVAGPSGLHLRRATNLISSTPAATQTTSELIPKVNGDDGSDSSESTSGCSSLVPQGERLFQIGTVPTPPLSGTRCILNRSRMTKTTPIATKARPKFDTFAFTNPLNRSSSFNTSRNTTLDDSSSFYKGRTMYGGASSCKESLSLSVLSPRVSTPKIVSVKPSSTPVQVRDTIGSSAKRILQALEQFSTPVTDVKRFPMKPESERRKRKAPQPFEELSIPQMPDLLRIKRKEKSTASQVSAADRSTLTASPLVAGYQLPPPIQPSFLSEDDPPLTKHVGSIKGKNTQELESERVPEVHLPNVQLPITTLPTFNLSSLPKPPVSAPSTLSSGSLSSPFSKTITTPATGPSSPLKFKVPSSVVSTCDSKPMKLPSAFKFSEPLAESKDGLKVPSTKFENLFSEPLPAFDKTAISKSPVSIFPKNDATSPIRNSSSIHLKLKRKSEEDDKPSSNSIDTPKTPVDNNSLFKNSQISVGFGDKFKPPAGSWVCDTCFVNNNADKTKCAACESSKSDGKGKITGVNTNTLLNGWTCKKCSLSNSETDGKCKSCSTSKGETSSETSKSSSSKGLEAFIKVPADTWECKECFVRNDNSKSSCIACSSPKPGATSVASSTSAPSAKLATPSTPLTNSISWKKPTDSWECSTCLVNNKSDVTSCVACTTPKPGSNPAKTSAPTFQFGMPSSTISGSKSNATTTPTFSFGVPSSTTNNSTSSGSTNEKSDSKAPPPVFSFGIKTDSAKSNLGAADESIKNVEKSEKAAAAPVIFSFGAVNKTNPSASIKSNEDSTVVLSEDEEPSKPKKKVSFGEPLVEEKTSPVRPSQPVGFLSSTGTSGSTPFPLKTTSADDKPVFGNCTATSSSDSAPASSLFNLLSGNSTGVSSTTDSTSSSAAATSSPQTVKSSVPAIFLTNSGNTSGNTFSGFQTSENKNSTFSSFTDKPVFNSAPNENPPKSTESFGFWSKPEENNANKMTKNIEPYFKNKTMNNIFSSKTETPSNSLFGMPQPGDDKSGFFNSTTPSNENLFNKPNHQNLFGSSQLSPAKGFGSGNSFPAQTPGFNAETTPAQPPNAFGVTTPTFGAQANSVTNNAEQPKPFAFNATATPAMSFGFMNADNKIKPAPAAGGFSFNSSQTNTNAPASTNSLFNSAPDTPKFGVQQPQPQQQQSLFGMGVPASTPFTFGAPQPQPEPIQQPFGAVQPSLVDSLQQQQQQQQPIFGFGATQPSQPQAGSPFSFGAQNSRPAEPPTFNPNIEPNFNFSGGATPSFSAPPMPIKGDRKIRKAIRRTQPRPASQQ